jgi:hypothetical protein
MNDSQQEHRMPTPPFIDPGQMLIRPDQFTLRCFHLEAKIVHGTPSRDLKLSPHDAVKGSYAAL